MDTTVQSILDDLYQTDPSLRESDAQVRKIVTAMLAARPTIAINEQFRKELRARLLSRAHELSQAPAADHNPLTLFSMNKLYYALGGAMLAVVLIVPIVYLNSGLSGGSQSIAFNASSGEKVSFAPSLMSVKANAFGTLALSNGGSPATTQDSSSRNSAPMAAPEASKMMAPGFGGGGGGTNAGTSMIYPPQEYVQYRYVYTGEPLTLDADTVQVLKRVKNATSSSLAQFLKTFNFEGINLKSFGDSVLQNLNFIQNKDYGYNVSISLSEGSLSISENWEKWYSCPNGVCPEYQPLSIDKVPTNEKIISLADAFVKEHGIDVSQYGIPEVQNEWRVMYDRALTKEGYYIPDTMTVVYPLMIDGKVAYDEGGNKSGLRVNVNIRLMKVAGLWDFNSQDYQSSSYTAETDAKKILSIAERGGIYGYYDPNAGKTVDIELGKPELAYLKYWNYRNGVSDELLVPSLVFPITNLPDDPNFYRKSVIIPLAKDLLEVPNGGPGMPMPLTEPAMPRPAVDMAQ